MIRLAAAKKGISPLIATVLIIGFTVALAAVIMIWGQSFSKSVQKSTEQSAKVQLVCAQDVAFEMESLCYHGNKVYIIVKNNGNVEIEKYIVRMFKDANTAESANIDKKITPFAISTHDFEVSSPEFAQSIEKVELIPIVKVEGKDVTCQNNILGYDVEISECPESLVAEDENQNGLDGGLGDLAGNLPGGSAGNLGGDIDTGGVLGGSQFAGGIFGGINN